MRRLSLRKLACRDVNVQGSQDRNKHWRYSSCWRIRRPLDTESVHRTLSMRSRTPTDCCQMNNMGWLVLFKQFSSLLWIPGKSNGCRPRLMIRYGMPYRRSPSFDVANIQVSFECLPKRDSAGSVSITCLIPCPTRPLPPVTRMTFDMMGGGEEDCTCFFPSWTLDRLRTMCMRSPRRRTPLRRSSRKPCRSSARVWTPMGASAAFDVHRA